MPLPAKKNPHQKNLTSSALRAHQNNNATRRTARFPWHAWPANDNKPPMWRSTIGWAIVGTGIGGFAFVAVSLLL